MSDKTITVIRRKSPVASPKDAAFNLDIEAVKAEIRVVLLSILRLTLTQIDKIEVTIQQGEKTTIYEIDLDQSDFGRLLGAKGKNIGFLRGIVANIASAYGFRAVILVKDESRFF